MSRETNIETPESRLALGCLSTIIVGVISYWAVIGGLWELIEPDKSQKAPENEGLFIFLATISAPLAIPLLGFIVRTVWRIATDFAFRRPKPGTGVVDSCSDPQPPSQTTSD